MKPGSYSIVPVGDSALVLDFGNKIEASLHEKVMAFTEALRHEGIIGIRDIVPAYSSITVHYDITILKKTALNTSAFDTLKVRLEGLLPNQIQPLSGEIRKLRIPVCYSAKYARDIVAVALYAKKSVNEVIEMHTSKTYRVYMIGFLPGFAYMGEVNEQIALPRKLEPRLQIEAGSVGIAGKQTGIYPLTSPGGWHIIGRTPVKLFDKTKTVPVLFAAGDEVEFFSITEDEFNSY